MPVHLLSYTTSRDFTLSSTCMRQEKVLPAIPVRFSCTGEVSRCRCKALRRSLARRRARQLGRLSLERAGKFSELRKSHRVRGLFLGSLPTHDTSQPQQPLRHNSEQTCTPIQVDLPSSASMPGLRHFNSTAMPENPNHTLGMPFLRGRSRSLFHCNFLPWARDIIWYLFPL